jgi:hypothetical protein
MKRRRFNQAVGLAGLTSSLGIPLGAGMASAQRLTIDCFRHVRSEHENEWLPFTIGLGQRGRELAAQFDRLVAPDQSAMIYALSHAPSSSTQVAPDTSDKDLLGNAYSGVLMLDLNETQAWPLALDWANRMQAQDVYLKVAILCTRDIDTALAHPLTRHLRSILDTVILQPDCPSSDSVPGWNSALLSARLFLMEPGLICWDIADLRTVLGGQIATATSAEALPSSRGGNPQEAVDRCHDKLQGKRITGGVGHWIAGLESLSIQDFDVIRSRWNALFGKAATTLVATSVDLSLPDAGSGLLNAIWTLPTAAFGEQ